MIDMILRDAELHPGLFLWKGPLSAPAIHDWERALAICAPNDLKQLWALKGGGDLFESEAILQPFGTDAYDTVEPVSLAFWGRGLSSDFLVFHTGVVDSAFRKSDGALFSLESTNFTQMTQFRDLDEWYLAALRSVHAERYRLVG